MANFRTKARAIDLLGRNQIADLPTAITELWKNGYDAYGDYLDAGLYRAGYKDVKYDIFTISDDGFGMNESDILNKWIVIGTDNKKNSDNFIPLEDRFGKEERVPLGEKGIGRLSVTYLGNHMLMITKKLNQPFQLVFMNWKALENYQLYLDEVEIPTAEILNLEQINEKYQYLQELYLENFQSESWKNFINLKEDILSEIAKYKNVPTAVMKKVQNHFQEKGHGTYFIIFDPINEIVDLEKEQESNLKEEQEDISEQTKYVRSALSGLFNPFDKKLLEERKNILGEDIGKTPSFTIYTPDGNEHDFLQLKDFFSEEEFTSCEHWIDGSFDDTGCFSGKIKVFGKVEEYSYISRKRPKCKIGNLRLKLAFWEGAKANTSMSEEKWHLYENKGEVFSGLYVYRDGFRVLPYGRTDFDFLEFEKNRSKSAGIYYFSHRKMFGFIGITKKENSRLIDKSGREGFVANDAYRASDERVRHIIQQANYYGYSGEKVKGIIFCSSIKETQELSDKFNNIVNPDTGKYFRTIALNGDATEQERQNAFERLAMDENEENINKKPLDYIFSVEILNEGVDIVEVNQVIMLRPTQSPIIFIQQLGRGLRKADGKEYVVILDFIGNYNNNFMIPIALSGDRTYNKDNIRRYIMEGGRVIPGASTVHFDEISKKRIFASVDNANFSDIKLIKENYTNLKNKLGRIPHLRDFDDYGEMDVARIFDNNSLGSYYKFLVKYEKDYKLRLSQEEEKIVEFISKKLANGKRIQELQLLKRMLMYAKGLSKCGLFSSLSQDMLTYGKLISKEQKENIINVMTNEFPAGSGKKTYAQCVFIEKEGNDYKPTKTFLEMLSNKDFYNIIKELVDFGISRYERDYKQSYDVTDFVLYQKYTYEDVCRLLNWEQNEVPLNIGGYKYDKKTKTFPVFINYDKSDDISDTTKYEDHFEQGFRDRLIAISKSGRSLQSEDVQNFLKAKERGIRVELFVRKNKDDKISKEFYYLGHMTASGNTKEFTMPNTQKTAVEIEWILDVPVREDIYEYIVNS